MLELALKAIFIENMIFALFLGMCSYLAVSKKVDTSVGMGCAVWFVTTVTCPASSPLPPNVMVPSPLEWGLLSIPPNRDGAITIGGGLGNLQLQTITIGTGAQACLSSCGVVLWGPSLAAGLGLFWLPPLPCGVVL